MKSGKRDQGFTSRDKEIRETGVRDIKSKFAKLYREKKIGTVISLCYSKNILLNKTNKCFL